MTKVNKLFIAFLAVFSFMFTNASVLMTDGNAYAASACTYDANGVPSSGCSTAGSDANNVNTKIYQWGATVSSVVVGVALLFIIYGGFKYVTSQGDPRATETAKNQIMFAGIGMLIVMVAFLVLKLFAGASGATT